MDILTTVNWSAWGKCPHGRIIPRNDDGTVPQCDCDTRETPF